MELTLLQLGMLWAQDPSEGEVPPVEFPQQNLNYQHAEKTGPCWTAVRITLAVRTPHSCKLRLQQNEGSQATPLLCSQVEGDLISSALFYTPLRVTAECPPSAHAAALHPSLHPRKSLKRFLHGAAGKGVSRPASQQTHQDLAEPAFMVVTRRDTPALLHQLTQLFRISGISVSTVLFVITARCQRNY